VRPYYRFPLEPAALELAAQVRALGRGYRRTARILLELRLARAICGSAARNWRPQPLNSATLRRHLLRRAVSR
jgi:hypothetical protein